MEKKFPDLQTWTLHYLDGKMIIELECAKDFTAWQALREYIQQDLKSHDDIKQVRLISMHEVINRETP